MLFWGFRACSCRRHVYLLQLHLIKGDLTGKGVNCGARVKAYHAHHASHAPCPRVRQVGRVISRRKAAALAECFVCAAIVSAASRFRDPESHRDYKYREHVRKHDYAHRDCSHHDDLFSVRMHLVKIAQKWQLNQCVSQRFTQSCLQIINPCHT